MLIATLCCTFSEEKSTLISQPAAQTLATSVVKEGILHAMCTKMVKWIKEFVMKWPICVRNRKTLIQWLSGLNFGQSHADVSQCWSRMAQVRYSSYFLMGTFRFIDVSLLKPFSVCYLMFDDSSLGCSEFIWKIKFGICSDCTPAIFEKNCAVFCLIFVLTDKPWIMLLVIKRWSALDLKR